MDFKTDFSSKSWNLSTTDAPCEDKIAFRADVEVSFAPTTSKPLKKTSISSWKIKIR